MRPTRMPLTARTRARKAPEGPNGPTKLSEAQDALRRVVERPRRSKYGNRRVVANGVLFDSQLERQRAFGLEQLRLNGSIDWWSYGPRYLLQEQPLITYRPDFLVRAGDQFWAEDTKGVLTKEFALKRRLWQARYPHIELRVVR